MEKQENTKLELKQENTEDCKDRQEWQKPELFLLDIDTDTLNTAAAGGDSVGRS